MGYERLKLCSGGGGFEAVPRPKRHLDLEAIRRALVARSIPVIDARVMLIAQFRREVTIARDGRVLIQSRDPEEAEALWKELAPLLEAPG